MVALLSHVHGPIHACHAAAQRSTFNVQRPVDRRRVLSEKAKRRKGEKRKRCSGRPSRGTEFGRNSEALARGEGNIKTTVPHKR
jgi:hypothetical protein